VSSRATGYFRPGDSWLHRRHPLTKLIAFLLVLLVAFLLPAITLPILIVLVLAAAASCGLLGETIRSLRIPIVLFASIFVVNAFFFPGSVDRIISFGPVGLSREGIVFGLTTVGRLLAVFIASILFLFTTLADDLLEALVSRGISHRLAFVALSAVQLVPRLQGRAASILDAQQARGLPVTGSFRTRTRAVVPLVGPIVLGSLIDVRERTFALEARAFGARPKRTAFRVVNDPPMDRWLRYLLLIAGAILIVASVGGAFNGL
jgi:energy-coupling factor transport system permease protein